MLSKSAVAAAVAGGVTTVLVIAMASGISPKSAHADTLEGHGEPRAESHGDSHGESHTGSNGGGADPRSAHGSQGAVAMDDHGPDTQASAKPSHGAKPAAVGHGSKPAAPDAHAKADPAMPAASKDKHADPQADSHTVSQAASHSAATPSVAGGTVSAEDALKMLIEGNERWVKEQATNPNGDAARRKEVAEKGQTPFVTVLTCADSRLPVERIVDRGVGEVFVVRVAGNIAGVSETGTVEYGLGHLNTPLLVVMGHTKCGAVAAAASGAEVHGKIADIVDAIEPAVERAKRKNPGVEGADLVAAAVKENVWQTVFGLIRESKEIRGLVAKGKVKVVGAMCDLSTGKIEWLGEHPWQMEMIDALAGTEKHGGH
jgi:carbonic anhydrase